MYCSTCGSRMKSKGPRIKQINHSILQNGFKLEVEALVSRSISYMTEEYVPRLLKEGDFLD